MVKALALVGIFLLCLLTALLGLLSLPVYAYFDRAQAMRVAVAFDQLANTVLRGHPDETLSAKAYRMRHRRQWPVRLIDWLFFRITGQVDHCKGAFDKEQNRRQLPESYGRDTP